MLRALVSCFVIAVVVGGVAVAGGNPQVKLETNKGEIVIELDQEKAPVTVKNFLEYVQSGHYDGTIFHRVIPGFMIQGGGFAPNMAQKQTREPIVNEAANGLKNTRGTLAMARTPDPNSASSQFFINLVNNDFLNFKAKTQEGFGYCVFGKVVTGMSVVDAIAQAQTGSVGGHQNVPLQAIVIKKASVVSAAPAATKP
jgi:peptidyl-prolyl cis-trans isomerase B (cyclophilin B)